MYISVRVFPLSVLCFDLVFFPIVSRLWASSRSPLDVQGNNRVTELQLQTANCVWITFCFLDMIDMKKNGDASGTNYQIIISRLTSAWKGLVSTRLVDVLPAVTVCHAGRGSMLPIAFLIIEIRCFLWVEPGLGVTWKHLFYGEDV